MATFAIQNAAAAPANTDRESRLVVGSLLRSASLNMEDRDYEAAEAILRQGLTLEPENPEVLASLAICLAEGRGRFVTAEKLALKAVQAARRSGYGYYAPPETAQPKVIKPKVLIMPEKTVRKHKKRKRRLNI